MQRTTANQPQKRNTAPVFSVFEVLCGLSQPTVRKRPQGRQRTQPTEPSRPLRADQPSA